MSPKRKNPSADYEDEAGRWLAFARGDLESATALLGTGTPNRNVGYLAQQAVEKALKAVILLDNAPFEMTHDLTSVAAQLPADLLTPVDTADLAWLADLETSARYPDEGDMVTGDDARRAAGMADAILASVAAHFTVRGVDEAQIDPE
ncbi:MAG: HEPN domain-containing protein [Candidatus Limnocylindrales bacterium]